MDTGQRDSTPGDSSGKGWEQARKDFLFDKSKGGNSGTYRQTLATTLDRFELWHEARFGHGPLIESLDEALFREFARALVRYSPESKVPIVNDNLADSTALTYYANVSAFVGWLVREGLLDDHVANNQTAKEPLPEDAGRRSGDQQAWSPEQRVALMEYVDKRAREAIDQADAGDWDTIRECRNRALAAVLAFTGIRGSEFLANPRDDRRNGITWDDINLDEGKVTVLSKKQEWDDRSLPSQTHRPLRQLRRVLEAPGDWPVFVSLHRPSVYEAVREGIRGDVSDEDRIETLLDDNNPFELLREFQQRPPALTTDGARRVMQRITESADIDVEEAYLQPHGGRRGLGEIVVRTRGFTAAARVLDDSEEMVRERYSHIEAGELAGELSDAIETVDNDSG